MSCSQLHVITGATGLVGSAIALELLRSDARAQVLAVVRPHDHGRPSERLRRTLEHAARLHGLGDALDVDIHERCHAVAGDVHEPCCGVEVRPEWAGAELWHCAAALYFQDRYEAEVLRTNVDGTRHVLELARALDVRALDVVSTAYVAGDRTGTILETPVALEGQGAVVPNNAYERSKVLAEGLVLASGLRARILRPSIVIGHSRTQAALTFNGLYGFTRGVFKFRRLLERTQPELVRTLQVQMLADAEGQVDLVPVDFVARDAVELSLADAEPGIYHLASVVRRSTRRTIEVVFETVGLRPPQFVEDPAALAWLDRKLDKAVAVYRAYLFGSKRFDRSRTDRWLAQPTGAGYALPDHELRRFCQWYLDTELATRAPLPETV